MDDAAAIVAQILVGVGNGVVAHGQGLIPRRIALPAVANKDLFVCTAARRRPIKAQTMKRGNREWSAASGLGRVRFRIVSESQLRHREQSGDQKRVFQERRSPRHFLLVAQAINSLTMRPWTSVSRKSRPA